MLSAAAGIVFARPAALWIAAAAIPVIVLYFLRMRFRRKEVGSNFIWRSLTAPTTGGQTLRRRSILLLLIQVAAIAVATFAAAGPSLVSRELRRPGTAILVDVSASMSSRIGAAAEAAAKALDETGDGSPLLVFACSDSARPLLKEATQSKAAAKAALRSLAATSAAFDEAACADEVAAILSRAGGSWESIILTDGGLDLGGRRLEAALGDAERTPSEALGDTSGTLKIVEVGGGEESLGVAGLRLAAGPEGTRAEFSLWNGSGEAREARLSLSKDGATIARASLSAEPGWSRPSFAIPGRAAYGAYELRVGRESERGSAQAEAAPGASCYLSISKPRKLTALLVGRDDPFIKAALAHRDISYARSAAFPAEVSADIVIADSVPVPAGLKSNLLVFGLPPPDAPLAARGRSSGAIAPSGGDDQALTRFVSWDGAKAESSIAYEARGQSVVLATINGSPAIAAWERDGYRCMAVGVDLGRSNLGLKSAFPVLLLNYMQWCAPSADEQSEYTLSVGESVRRLEPDSFRVPSPTIDARRTGPAVSLIASKPGIFEWSAGAERGSIAVNVPASELDTSSRRIALSSGEGERNRGEAARAFASVERETTQPLGIPAAMLLALLLSVEWLAWRQGSLRTALDFLKGKRGKAAGQGGRA